MTDRRRAGWPVPLLLCAALWCGTGAAGAAEPMVDFIVVRADTLIGLSRTVLVSPNAWREVARLNRLPDPNFLLPGQRLRIPERLLRADAVSATLVSVSGDVRAGGAPVQAGAAIAEGQSLQTGPDGSAVLALADGSRVQLPPSSLAEVAASRNVGARPSTPRAVVSAEAGASGPSHWFAGTMRLLRGSVEVLASKVPRAKPLEVVTPTAVVGVRGTRYRVGYDAATNGRTHAEVVEGTVRFETAGAKAAADVTAGFGAAVDTGAAAPSVARLLPAPDLSVLPARFERPIVRFALPDAATPLRVQVASDAAFDRIAADQQVGAGSEVRLVGLADAAWQLRVRRIDARGIEGFDTTREFVLKARPEPPAYRAPRSDAKQAVGGVEFAWAPNVEAPRARLQVAEDDAFTRLVDDRDNIDAQSLRAELPRPGTYHWRLASIRPDGDHGPFGDAQRFELRPMPEPPSAGRSDDGGALLFRWGGRSGDRYQAELARDREFKQVEARAELPGPEWSLPTPGGGRYYFRYRSVETDGFVTPYSETLQVEVPRDWRWLGVFVPLLLMLF